jgi:hypothetical protein
VARTLRQALDGCATPGVEVSEEALSSSPILGARDDYIDVVLDRSPDRVDRFFRRHAARELHAADRVTALKLLEMQRHAMLMYTSCGWFFDELSGIETVQCMQYAGRVIDLARQLFPEDVETAFWRSSRRRATSEKVTAQIYRKCDASGHRLRKVATHTPLPRCWSRPPTCAASVAMKSSANTMPFTNEKKETGDLDEFGSVPRSRLNAPSLSWRYLRRPSDKVGVAKL